MFGWRVEVELLGVKICSLNVRVEKTDCRGAHEILSGQVVPWLLGFLDGEEERLNSLVELVGCSWINHLVVEGEVSIFKVLFDRHCRVKVNWGASHHASIWVEVKALSWSL